MIRPYFALSAALILVLSTGCATTAVYHLGLSAEWKDVTGPLEGIRTADQVVLSYATLPDPNREVQEAPELFAVGYPLSDAQFCAEQEGKRRYCFFDEPFYSLAGLPKGEAIPIRPPGQVATLLEGQSCELASRSADVGTDTTLRCRLRDGYVCEKLLPAKTTYSRVERSFWSYPARIALYPFALVFDVVTAPLYIGHRALRISNDEYWVGIGNNLGLGAHPYTQTFYWSCSKEDGLR